MSILKQQEGDVKGCLWKLVIGQRWWDDLGTWFVVFKYKNRVAVGMNKIMLDFRSK